MVSKHDRLVELLEERLIEKPRGRIFQREAPVYNSKGRLVYVADLMALEFIDNKEYRTFYEVKTGEVRKAYDQAAAVFDALRWRHHAKINFVLVSELYGVRRIRDAERQTRYGC